MSDLIEGYLGKTVEGKKTDYLQNLTICKVYWWFLNFYLCGQYVVGLINISI